MNEDRYGLALSTRSSDAAAAYREGIDLTLAGWPGAAECFDRALACDPELAVAHAARARLHAMYLERDAAREALARARAAAANATQREQAHVEILAAASEGRAADALVAVPRHLESHPRDALVLSTLLGAFGLYAFSGRADHDAARVAICERLAPHYGEDWWFLTHLGWSQTENGSRVEGRGITERALALRLDNAHAAHALAHAMFEQGEADAARGFITGWLPRYDAAGVLHSHIAWHRALVAAQMGDAGEAFTALSDTLDPAITQAPPLNVVTDLASLLWRLKVYGHDVPEAAWSKAAAYASALSPRLAAPFAAVHFAMIEAGAGAQGAVAARAAALEAKLAGGTLAQGPVLPALCRGIAAYAAGDHGGCIAAIEPHLADIVRIGGSHAQREIFEDTLIAACLKAGEPVKASVLLDARLHQRPSALTRRWREAASGGARGAAIG